jgi:hypothetical protein
MVLDRCSAGSIIIIIIIIIIIRGFIVLSAEVQTSLMPYVAAPHAHLAPEHMLLQLLLLLLLLRAAGPT